MSDIITMLNDYIRAELIILIPVLYYVNCIINKTKIKAYAPYITGIVSITLCAIYTFAHVPIQNISQILMAIFTSITQGILIVGASVYSNIVIKIIPAQLRCEKNESLKEDLKK